MVNAEIRANSEVGTKVMPLEQAKASGAEALFGEKYDENVRVVNMGDFSFELCGGTHVARTGDIGLLLITNETGIAAGIRRIEAVTGVGALEYAQQQFQTLDDTANLVRGNRADVTTKVEQLIQRVKELEKDKAQLQRQLSSGGGSNLLEKAQDINGIKVLAARMDGVDTKTIRSSIDQFRDKLGDSVVVLAATDESKAKLICGVSRSLTDKVNAGKLINDLVSAAGGRGGGRPDMAEGGIPLSAVDQCLDEVARKVKSYLAETGSDKNRSKDISVS